MTDLPEELHPTLVSLPGLETLTPADYRATRLGGLTNLVFRIECASGNFILRIPGKGTAEYIDRAVELHNARAAAAALTRSAGRR